MLTKLQRSWHEYHCQTVGSDNGILLSAEADRQTSLHHLLMSEGSVTFGSVFYGSFWMVAEGITTS